MKKKLGLSLGVLVLACFVGVAFCFPFGNGNTPQKRVRKHFGIPESTPLTPKTIRAAILGKLPAGSTQEEVYTFLKKCGIGKDKYSSFYRADEHGEVVCRIDFDPGSGDIGHTHYGILLQLDSGKKLRDIHVKEWYTGP